MAHEFGNDPAKIEGYRKFWRRDPAKRPLVGFSMKSWFPLDEFSASAAWPKNTRLRPEQVEPEAFLDDQEKLLREGEVMADDIIRGASPSQAVFWCGGTLGCEMRILPGNVVAEDRSLPWEECLGMKIDLGHPWFRKYLEFIDALVKRSAGRFPVSHGTLLGPLDFAVSLRGHEQVVVDFFEEPEKAERLIREMGDAFVLFTKTAWKRIPMFHGGYFDAQYSLWAPGTIARMQEDAIAVLSPTLYRQFVQPVDRRVASVFETPFMHLHATSMMVLDLLLEVEGIKCFEANNDVGGPPVAEIVPCFRRIQDAGRPLIIRGSFTPDEAKILMDSLDPRGLYLYVMVENQGETDALRPIFGM